MILETVKVGGMDVNCYILSQEGDGQAVIIDPGEDSKRILRKLKEFDLRPGIVINTHGHFDHIGADDDLGVPVYIHRLDAPMLTSPELNFSRFFSRSVEVKSARIKTIDDGQLLKYAGIELKVIHTPGHSPGGICLQLNASGRKILFSGDTLFRDGVGRTDFQGSDQQQLIDSLKNKLFILDPETLVLPGHGGQTTIGRESSGNPFLDA